jgi:molecular chaperone DnaK
MSSRIKYGIDLGTTNSAIAVINKGESVIVKNEQQKDTTPSCVSFNKKKGISVGDRSYNQLGQDRLFALKKGEFLNSNNFIEFKRTMGSDNSYASSFMGINYSSEDLSAEILKKLKFY